MIGDTLIVNLPSDNIIRMALVKVGPKVNFFIGCFRLYCVMGLNLSR